ncbi:MAG TPA: protein kinase, partial [Bryobacteraceae bacterium]
MSALNHPNICTLHDVGSEDGISYLVMEYVEGKPPEGPLPLAEALRLAIQIAAAIEAAHQKGIVHRDLKPSNILLTKSGLKLLDFGLAKFAQGPRPVEDVTVTTPLTGGGQILGTLQYMSPEQLEGKEADERSDIFAFGLVLYELLTGRKAFPATSQASLIAAIMKEDPPPIAVLQALPFAALDRTLKKCLAKDPARRWQTATDLRDELIWIAESDAVAPQAMSRRRLLPWIAGAALAGAGGAGLAAWAWRRGDSTPSVRTIRLKIQGPADAWPERVVTRQTMAISPVGDRIAIVISNDRGPMVWIQRLDSFVASPLPGTEGARIVFWSPDGKFIGFWAEGKLKKIAVDGGTPLPICDIPPLWSATWNDDGVILASMPRTKSWMITVKTGVAKEWKPVFWPRFLPGGKHVLYVNVDPDLHGYRAYVEEISSGRQMALMPTETQAIFAPDRAGSRQGHLLYCRGATLLAQRFDAEVLSVLGEPAPVAQGIPFFQPTAWSEFDASVDGVLVYVTGWQRSQLTWLDRQGKEIGTVGTPKEFWSSVRISPDGSKVAADVADPGKGGADLWAFDLAKGTAERLTSDPGVEASAVWSPDGTRLAYGSAQAGAPQLKVRALYEQGNGQVFPPGPFQIPNHWSADGRWIFYQTSGTDANSDIWIASVQERTITQLVQTSFNVSFPALSPNGEYLAFSANDTGRDEVYLQ